METEDEKYLNIGIKNSYAQVNYLQFGIASPEEILANSVCEITSTNLKGDMRNTIYDPRMGVLGIGKDERCETCGNTDACPGHFGHITLETPIIHCNFFKTIYSILKCVCNSCSASLLTEDQSALIGISKFREPSKRLNAFIVECLKIAECPRCKDPVANYTCKDNKIKVSFANSKKQADMETKDIYEILTKISNEDFALLGFNTNLSKDAVFKNEKYFPVSSMCHRHQIRPEWMIFTVLPVLPIAARPYSVRDGDKHDDDLTDKYLSIVKVNLKLEMDRIVRNGGFVENTTKKKSVLLSESERKKLTLDLEEHVRTLIDNSKETSKVSGRRAHKGLKERMSDKEGQVRKHIMGKRVDFSARTVITGDPTLAMDELGMPISVCQRLTRPLYVIPSNIDYAQKLIDQRMANWIFRRGTQIMVDIVLKNKDFKIQLGDVIDRQLVNGDWVLFNRQPTLRIESAMGFRVRRMIRGKTFRFGLSATTPYNADFDGDEMNVHVPQSTGGFLELSTFISVSNRIVSAQHNAPIMGLVQDALLGGYILTEGSMLVAKYTLNDCITELHFHGRVLNILEYAERVARYYPDCVVKRRGIYEFKDKIPGRVLFSTILPADFFYEKKIDDNAHVIIKEGIVTAESVRLCKKTLGNKSNSIVHVLYIDYSAQTAADFLSNAQFVINRWFPTVGFSVGIESCMIDNKAKILETLNRAKIECDKKIRIGSEILEKEINAILNSTTNIGDILTTEGVVGRENNSIVVMYKSGAKGSHINVTQMDAYLGQQNVNGQRIPLMLSRRKRCNPYFDVNDTSLASRGFVDRCFLEGLTPQQTFFHAMGGREGIIDTAIKTAKSGYIERRIVKKVEDLKVYYDGTVRRNDKSIIQFLYGFDGFDASRIFNVRGRLFFVDPFRLATLLNYKNKSKGTPQPLSDNIKDLICKSLRVNKFCTDTVDYATKKIRAQLGEFLSSIKLVPSAIEAFAHEIKTKFHLSLAQPGEMVGIVAALSIGEPTTQSTLNTFHFAGLSEKDVTLGVIKLEECMNATKNPKTPSCAIYVKTSKMRKLTELLNRAKKDKDEDSVVKIKKACLEYLQRLRKDVQYCELRSLLKKAPELCFVAEDQPGFSPVLHNPQEYKEEWWVCVYKSFNHTQIDKHEWVLQFSFDVEKLYMSQITLEEIAECIKNTSTSEKSFGDFECIISPQYIGKIDVYIDFDKIEPPEVIFQGMESLINESNFNYFYARDIVCKRLISLKISGIENISKAYPKELCIEGNSEWILDTQGANFKKVLVIPWVDVRRTTCDDFWQVYYCLGIEAAQRCLALEYNKALSFDGGYIDPRHDGLLIEAMSHIGTITSASREGIDRSVGPLAKCAFEETLDNFTIAATFCEKENISGVSASITMGKLAQIGTGCFDVLPKINANKKTNVKSYVKRKNVAMYDIVKENY